MKYDVFVSLVIPLFDDGDILAKVMDEVFSILKANYQNYEVIFVDDDSTDHTKSLFEERKDTVNCFRYFRLSRKFGLETAIACGLDQAIGDIVIILRPECDPPGLIVDFVKQAQSCQGIVIGKRNLFENCSWLYRLTYNIYYYICQLLLERPQIYCSTYFMAFTRTALNSILKIKDVYRYIRILSMYAGYKVQTLTYKQIERRQQKRRRKLFSLIDDSVSTIVSNTILPLRLAALFAIPASLLNFGYVGYVLFFEIFFDSVEGWASSSSQNSIMFGLIFAIFAVICEYLARLIEEVKVRPLYFIRDEIESNVMLSSEVRNVVYNEQNIQQ